MEEPKNKFTESEMIVGGFAFLGVDAVCLALDLTGVGIALTPFLQGAATFFVEWWVKSKSGSWGALDLKRVAKYLANAIPFFPTVLFIFIVSAFIHNHPEKLRVFEKAAAGKGGGTAKAAGGV
ncbi:MAG: hypothetical protein HYU81_01745 [Candidatus Brennerbacteria bacterium]|nr:hypothetical protein [Candidatus Brennerbacteria bacterium]